MQFKAGDRVHVTKFEHKEVDFYATLGQAYNHCLFYRMVNCSNSDYEDEMVWNECLSLYGKNKKDYYVLAENEEDTEEPVIQHINDMYNEVPKEKEQSQKVELKNHYIIEVKKGLYVALVASNGYLKLTNDINKADEYEFENAAMKHAKLVDGRILNLKRHVEV